MPGPEPRRPRAGRWVASLRGEVPTEDVRAMLAVGGGAYEDALSADQLRADLLAAGVSPFDASPAESSQLLCAWNAFALQSLAQAFLDAEEAAPRRLTAGHVAGVTAEQIELIAAQVPFWSGQARRAAVDPGFDVAAEVPLPLDSLPWVAVEPCPDSHLAAMRRGGTAMLERVEAALADTLRGAAAADRPRLVRLQGLVADCQGRLAHAGAAARGARDGAHEAAEAALRAAVVRCLVLGQLLARPRLLDRPSHPVGVAPAAAGSRLGDRLGDRPTRGQETAMTRGDLACPRCTGPMTTVSRAGVEVDQCEDCRGIFLDRGELERLVEAEARYYSAPPAAPAYPPAGYPPQPAYDPRYRDDAYRGEHGGYGGEHGGRGRGRRRGFFDELFGD